MRKFACKMICILFAALLACMALPGCASGTAQEGVQIVATSFPAYDFARTLTKDCRDVNVHLLLSPGTESHSYDPSAADMMAVHDADLFIYIGADADAWAEPMIRAGGDHLEVFALTECVSLLEDEDHGEADPHVWTNPENVITIAERLSGVLCALPDMTEENADQIAGACKTFVAELQDLDEDFSTFFDALPEEERLMVFGDRFPFRYFATHYGVSYLSAFPGCAHESEPSAGTVMHLINTVKSRGISTVFYVECSEHRIADTIAAETGATTALFHSCHNVTKEEFEQDATYLSLMRENLERLEASFR